MLTANAGAVHAEPHSHHDCGSREGLWLAKEYESPATTLRHPYCKECGTVRNLAWPKARPIGHFLAGIIALKEYLDRGPVLAKLAQVQSHLMTSRLLARSEFEDPYGTPGQAQLDAYVNVVRSVRPDLDADLILRLLPHSRKSSAKGVASSGPSLPLTEPTSKVRTMRSR